MASKKNIQVTFLVTKADAAKVERIQNWNERHLRYGSIDHFGEVAFEKWLNEEYKAYEIAKEEAKQQNEKTPVAKSK
jgi:hypothetical protein